MNIVFVEDDPHKEKQVVDFIVEKAPYVRLVVCRSYASGLREIRRSRPDLVLLDMSLPNYEIDNMEEGGKFRSYAGRDILEQMRRRALRIPVVVLTQYETFSPGKEPRTLAQLSKELTQKFPDTFLGAVYYNASQDDWKGALLAILGRVHPREGE